jgi:hypothetical protein
MSTAVRIPRADRLLNFLFPGTTPHVILLLISMQGLEARRGILFYTSISQDLLYLTVKEPPSSPAIHRSYRHNAKTSAFTKRRKIRRTAPHSAPLFSHSHPFPFPFPSQLRPPTLNTTPSGIVQRPVSLPIKPVQVVRPCFGLLPGFLDQVVLGLFKSCVGFDSSLLLSVFVYFEEWGFVISSS